MRCVIVGYGVQGRKRLRVAGVDAVGIVDPVAPEAHWRDIREVPLDRFDAALVCTPDAPKVAILRHLAGAGKHALVEKPLHADSAQELGLLTINAFVAATGVIVPVQCEYLSLRGLVQLENTLAMVRENLNPQVGVEGIVATMYDGRTLHSREAIEILEENFGDLVYRTRIRKTIRYAEAPVKGSSVLKYDPEGPAAEAYRDLAKEVQGGAQAREHA